MARFVAMEGDGLNGVPWEHIPALKKQEVVKQLEEIGEEFNVLSKVLWVNRN